MTDQVVAHDRASGSRRLWVIVAVVSLFAACIGVGIFNRPSADQLRVVNPCPSEKDAAIYDHVAPREGDEPIARMRLTRGVNVIDAVEPSSVTDDWSLMLFEEGGSMSFQFKATGWFDQGIATIPALSCGPSDLSG